MPEPSRALIFFHLGAIAPALPLGAWLLLRPKGTPPHRLLGKVWVGLMATASISSFAIQFQGHFSWLHGLAALTLVALARAVHGARTHNVSLHKRNIFLAYAGSLLALLFALTPGRLLGDWVRGAAPARTAAQHP